ncbi:MAG: hypothetical protein J7L20_03880 [Thermoplasmata archaeon]|nr:hypothetical protein [Thermoplasmata archaeon]
MMRPLSWILMIIIGLASVGITISRRWIMKQFGEITISRAMDITTWLSLLFNPFVMFILGINLVIWFLGMWVFSMEEAPKVMAAMGLVNIPVFLLKIFMSIRVLGEGLNRTQWVGALLLLISMVFGLIGAYYMAGGVE